ncbi:MAG: hypothetical protein ACPGLV_00410 [Bacteroidia bacterium]
MKFIWIAITALLGIIMFLLVKIHFIWALPYLVVHISLIALLKFRGVLNVSIPNWLLPIPFIALQLVYSMYVFTEIGTLGLDEENYDKEFKYNLIRITLLVIEYPLLLEFFKKPKFERY